MKQTSMTTMMIIQLNKIRLLSVAQVSFSMDYTALHAKMVAKDAMILLVCASLQKMSEKVMNYLAK